MIRGTTPTHSFAIPIDAATVSKIRVTYEQGGADVLTKDFDASAIDNGVLSYKLTQEETLSFGEGCVSVQVRILTLGGDALASEITCIRPKTLLDDTGVLE